MKVGVQLSCNSYTEKEDFLQVVEQGRGVGGNSALRMSGTFSTCERLKLQTARNALAKCILFVGTSPPPLSTWVDVSVIHMITTSQASPSILRPGH